MAACTACTQPAPDSTICRNCQDQAAHHLRQIPWLVEQLTITLTRQHRLGDRNGPRSTETPVVFHEAASTDLTILRELLTRWAGIVSGHRGVTIDVPVQTVRLADGTTATTAAAPPIAELSRWLLRWNGAAAQHPEAADYLTELTHATRDAQRTIDRAPDLRCLGPCDIDGCEAWLYVPVHADIARCPSPDCDAEYRVEDRRAWLLEQSVDQLRTAAQLSRELPWIAGIAIDRKRINRWSSDGRITRYLPGPDDAKATRFRIGEVIDLARTEAVEAAAKRSASGAA